MNATPWRRVRRTHPCPICQRPDWCRVTADGTLAGCMRVEAGCFRAKDGRDGSRVYLHRLAGGPRPAADLPPRAGPAAERADADTLHVVYSALLARLTLSKAHREALRRRGLTDCEIDRRGYGSLPVPGRHRIARDLRERWGDAVLRVPGLVTRAGARGPDLTIAGAAGLLVPVRDGAGHIVALLSRRDDAADGRGKYLYLSSARHGGPGPGAPVHVPLGVTGPCDCLRVTEGALKADVAHARTGLPTVGLPGAATWRPVLPVLRALGARAARLALDADAADKAPVARALAALAEALAAEGLAVELERWPSEHKGIDDALAAGAAVEVLTGDDARRAIGAITAAGTAGEPPQEPSALDRLAEVLAGGAEAVYGDGELLRALARLAEAEPAEFACRRAQLQRAGVKLRDLDRALAPLRQEVRRERPPPDAAGCYRVSGGRIVREVLTRDGAVAVPLATWAGRIVEEVVRDDGAERSVTMAVEGALADGTPLPRVEVAADDWAFMRWPVERWGTRAVVLAGASTADHLRCALQLLSGDVPRRTVYAHTGWRAVGGRCVYLHAGGALGADGPAADIAVSLPDALAGYALPDPPEGRALADAIRASLRVLDLAPDRVTVPLLGAVYRAVLGGTDFAPHLAGPTGTGKTELAALAQQHHGAGLDARHLPAGWSSTGNALEALAFAAKDALLVVDDFAPGGTAADVARLHREADRLLRAQGNQAGRTRMRADATLRPAKPPRGLILSTGEDVPRGQSLRARLLTLELAPGELDWSRLSACQRDAAAGVYAAALAGYLRWLAPQYPEIRDGLRGEVAALRERAHAAGLHARTPGILAELAAGWRHWLDYAEASGALDRAERAALDRRVGAALAEAGAGQAEHVAAAEPSGQFLRLLAGALASGRAHFAAPDGGRPADPDAWGWRVMEDTWAPLGRRVGWIDGPDLYLEPEAAYAEAQELARHQGESLPVAPRTLWRRLRERGLLATWDAARQRHTVRRTLGGVEARDVLHVRADTLSSGTRPSQPSNGPPDAAATPEKRDGRLDGPLDGRTAVNARPSTAAVHCSAGAGETGRSGRSDTGEGGAAGANDSEPPAAGPRPPPGARLQFADAHGRPCPPSDAATWTWEGGPRWFDVATAPPPGWEGIT
jgi:hypothetical protein